ncbi:hypothetical protein NDU88_001608 [Pleurodeles waltl]|uniref:Uncharacterized protein n=1 Tax=Pleurodeles waltl TaxID=8319 RepID=A0AAV7R7Q1_PLEWA|nr:hypothetical protein NDU88_001608 [Pleurodeles waltl]
MSWPELQHKRTPPLLEEPGSGEGQGCLPVRPERRDSCDREGEWSPKESLGAAMLPLLVSKGNQLLLLRLLRRLLAGSSLRETPGVPGGPEQAASIRGS